jgi:hypothetical protein
MEAADRMAVAWKKLYEREDPLNAAFGESGASDLLALLGLTHELPALMRSDAKFTEEWMNACSGSCFEIWFDPKSPADVQYVRNLFSLVIDLRHNLKKERASEPVIQMLYDTKFTLGD